MAAREVRQGHYTYFAYAFHRQLPYGVPGAYRLLANLLSQNRARRRPSVHTASRGLYGLLWALGYCDDVAVTTAAPERG